VTYRPNASGVYYPNLYVVLCHIGPMGLVYIVLMCTLCSVI